MSNQIFTKEWLYAALIRSLRTLCQTAIATIGTSAVISAVDWKMVASASFLAAFLSLLTSLSGLPEVEPEKLSEAKNEVKPEAEPKKES